MGYKILAFVSGTFGGLSGDDYSGECSLSDGVTVYTARSPVKVQWKMERGDCHWGILTFCPMGDPEKVQTSTKK